MKKIGFFGGCFNPPTNMHIKIANNLIKQGILDKVVFVPVNDYYNKDGLIEAKHRYNMLCLAIKNHPNLEVDDILIKENRKLFAIDAFEIISNKMQGETYYLIMGSDNYNKMSSWKEYDKIKDRYNYIVVERDENEISSTIIRNMIKNNDKNVMEYLSEDVYKYILEKKMYKL